MKKLLFTLVMISAVSFTSCKKKESTTDASQAPEEIVIETTAEVSTNEYRLIAQEKIDALNTLIQTNGLNTEQAVLAAYAPKDEEAEGKYSYEITNFQKDNTGLSTITLIEDFLMDDSIKAKKVVMEFKTVEDHIVVVSIKESYQCYEGRGHQEWSAAFCS